MGCLGAYAKKPVSWNGPWCLLYEEIATTIQHLRVAKKSDMDCSNAYAKVGLAVRSREHVLRGIRDKILDTSRSQEDETSLDSTVHARLACFVFGGLLPSIMFA